MVHCWDEYMWNVHKAVPMDPWADNIELLDVLIQQRSSPSSWLPSWFRPLAKATHMLHVGSILTLGTLKDSMPADLDWKQQVVVDDTTRGSFASKPVKKDGTIGGGLKATDTKSTNGGIATSVETPNANAANPLGNGTMAAPVTADANKRLDVATDVPLGRSSRAFHIRSSSLPDIQASIKTSKSMLATLTGGSAAVAQFDVKGSKTVTCNVNGVKSRRVDVDALLKLVTPRKSSGLPALWQPDISLPELSWSSKRGQTLWVVVEIMYANKVRIEADNQGQAKAEAKAMGGKEATITAQAGLERDGLWTVMATDENPMFPLGFRLQRLDYDASGNLITISGRRATNDSRRTFQRNNSAISNVKHTLPSFPRSSSQTHQF